MAGSSVSWCSSKQGSISPSTAEAELIAFMFPQENPVQVWCDSKAAISTVKYPGNQKSTKHIEIRFLFTRDPVEEWRLEIQYCSTSDMAEDILTKALPTGQFIKLRERIRIKDLKTTGDT
ncbi:Copia-like retrotransposable element [Phytophthora megakarya]|uniref:Copia-like retrotransposable element n=1 Tax=Phytophthora megakarya TaxID=4795 RepID=A0A225VJ80_9STRA|nr:Copia-like retrotransposable element [Phytophthora megakarya]